MQSPLAEIPVKTEAERVAFLFERYQQLTVPLVTAGKTVKKNHQRYNHEQR